jgi:hypothetical protein
MKLLTMVCFLACGGLSHPAHAQATPDRVLLDNKDVRVVEYVLKPGERDQWNTHPPNVSYVVGGGTLRITLADGTSFVSEQKQGTAQWMNTSGRQYATNIGTTPVRIVLVEVKNATPVPSARVAPAASLDCVARMAAVPGNGTTTIDAARLLPGTPMPALAAGEPHSFAVSVVVDTLGRADPATLVAPAGLDPATVDAVRTVLPAWRFSPARLSGCPIKQVVRLTFSR